jgi:cobalt-precorrin-5B (C1)-methyltransferase
MIEQAVQEVLEATGIDRGVTVQISVPGGEAIAAKTFNPRLGIEGGISILGTTGIVTPYSTAAWRASVFQGIDVAAAQGCDRIAMTVGARGEKLARHWVSLPEVAYVQVGPFFGEALEHAAGAGIGHVSLVSMIGKLAKFAAGHGSVHSGRSEQDFRFLADLAREAGADSGLIDQMLHANTAQQAAQLAEEANLDAFFQKIADRAHVFADTFLEGRSGLDVLLIASDGRLLARTGSPPAA